MANQISDAELAIMKIIWTNAPHPTLFAQIMQQLEAQGRPCQKNTLITLLGRLIHKGYLTASKIGRKNEYRAVVSADQFAETQTRGFVDKYYEGRASELVTMLIQAEMLTPEEYEELRSCLDSAGTGK